MKKVYIETLGCQMNKSDEERMLGMLQWLDYEQTKEAKDADLLIINTCSIRQLSEDKAFSAIGTWGKWKKSRRDLKIVFAGCVAQQKKEDLFKRAPYVDLVLGTHRLYELPELIKRIEKGEKICSTEEIPYSEDNLDIIRKEGVNAWIPIMEGCNNFCSYCIVPYTRGRERSRKFEQIMNEVKKALSEGFKEITLLGQNVDSYHGVNENGEDVNLSALLRAINDLDGKFRIRFVTSYPTDITEELIDTVVELDKVCEYFHIPMQSGDDYVLKKMNRRYDVETYTRICNHIRNRVKDVTITSDFIAGFPGETEEQFQHTCDEILRLELDYSNTAAYSPREGTVAAKWKDKFLSKEVKEERLARLNEAVREACLISNKKYVGREMEILVERFENHKGVNVISGRTRNNKMVHVPCDTNRIGEFVNVKIVGVKTWYLKGELV